MLTTLTAGLLAGYGIAMPVGAMSILIVTISSRNSLRLGIAAGLGVASADGLYALVAVLGGTALTRWINPAKTFLQAAAATVLVVIAVRGLVIAARTYRRQESTADAAIVASCLRTYTGLVGLTLLNPVTIIYFAALVVGRQAESGSIWSGLLFVFAAFIASASWQVLLAGGGAFLRRILTSPKGRLSTAIAGNTVIILLAARLAWAARR
jgi:threonine/homoserine/homoserine lactone efflux protein